MMAPEDSHLTDSDDSDGSFAETPIGTKGTVTGVDNTGSLLVNWDNGSGLNVVWGVDAVRKVVSEND